MRSLFVILAIFTLLSLQAQDKVFFANGQVKHGIVVSIAKDAVFFKTSDTSAVQRFPKKDLLLIENYKGVRYVFGRDAASEGRENRADTVKIAVNPKRHYFGIQPLAVLVGRGTFVYEHFTKNDRIGFVVPLSITFDPFGVFYNTQIDTNRNAIRRISGFNFIAGADVNFYIGKKSSPRFFIGPRVRYGTDLFLRGIEAYTLQTQVGWKIEDAQGIFTQHLSVGFGFVRILSSPLGTLINPRQSYGWYSLNYRLGIRW
jgi:hypothetical protein